MSGAVQRAAQRLAQDGGHVVQSAPRTHAGPAQRALDPAQLPGGLPASRESDRPVPLAWQI